MPDITIRITVPEGTTVGVAEAGRGVSVAPGRDEPRSSTQQPAADPWDTDTPATADNAPASRSEPSRGGSSRSGTVTDSKNRVWTFGAAGSPSCLCGDAAVLVKGSTNGKSWEQWRCAKDFDDYKHKCKFSEWVDR